MQCHVQRAIFRPFVTESRRALATRGRVGSAVWAAAVGEGYPTRGEVHKAGGGEVGGQSSVLFLSLPRPPPLFPLTASLFPTTALLYYDHLPLLRLPDPPTTADLTAVDLSPGLLRRRRLLSGQYLCYCLVLALANTLIQVHLSLCRRWCIDPVSRAYSLSYAPLLIRPFSVLVSSCIHPCRG